MKDIKKGLVILWIFLGALFIPFANPAFMNAVGEALFMLKEYAEQHVIFCLIPAFFIAGAIANFITQGAVIKYLGAKANKVLAYAVSAVSGGVLAVCSCTVLPLFASIHKRGAGLGPAIAFLYSGPAINVLAIILTARVLGMEIGIARAAGAMVFSVIIGLLMALIFRKEEKERNSELDLLIPEQEKSPRKLWQTALYIFSMVAILVFANWGADKTGILWLWNWIYNYKFIIAGVFLFALAVMLILWFKKQERLAWLKSSYEFGLQIMPLLFGGVLIAGFLLGRPGHEGIIPSAWVTYLVGGNSLFSNFFAAIAGAFMYFATLTEVPIVQGLMGSGMGKGPALALLLAGPALSLPSMLVIRKVLGTKKTVVYISLVVIMSMAAGMAFGFFSSS
jgi:uncharacterized membrane protein YraQ (UPF0718 family)